MSISDKIRVVVGIVVAAGLFGVCAVVFNNEALPMWARIVTIVLAFTNLVCTSVTNQELFKRGKK